MHVAPTEDDTVWINKCPDAHPFDHIYPVKIHFPAGKVREATTVSTPSAIERGLMFVLTTFPKFSKLLYYFTKYILQDTNSVFLEYFIFAIQQFR